MSLNTYLIAFIHHKRDTLCYNELYHLTYFSLYLFITILPLDSELVKIRNCVIFIFDSQYLRSHGADIHCGFPTNIHWIMDSQLIFIGSINKQMEGEKRKHRNICVHTFCAR